MRIATAFALLILSGWVSLGWAQPLPTSSTAGIASLVGTYSVTGTETNGKAYSSEGEVSLTMEKSGAVRVNWDDGTYVGIGQLVGNVLAIGSIAERRVVIMLLTIKPDGTLEGKWWRNTDAAPGTEVWKRK